MEEILENAAMEEKAPLDVENLEARLEELTSAEFIQAERECRMAADPTPDIMYSAAFRARLAAYALNVPYKEIRKMKLPEYVDIISRVLNFLLRTLGEKVSQHNK